MTSASETIRYHLWQSQLIKEYDQINWSYQLKLVRPQIGVAKVSSFWGQWDPLLREIKISAQLIENFPWFVVIEVLKHEIAHQLVVDRLGVDDGHGPRFRSFCELLGVSPSLQKSQTQVNLAELRRHYQSERTSMPHENPEGEEARLLQRVERLLSLAQSGNQNEAVAAMEKVNELYEKYNLQRRSEPNHLVGYEFLIIDLGSTKLDAIYPLICHILNEHFFVQVILSTTYSPQLQKQIKTIELFSLPANLRVAEYAFEFLRGQAKELWERERRTSGLSHKLRRSFQIGLLHGFNAKLTSSKIQRRQTALTPADKKSLELLNTDPNLDHFVSLRYPRLSRRRTGGGRVDRGTFARGESEGKRLVLNKGLDQKTSSPGRFLLGKV